MTKALIYETEDDAAPRLVQELKTLKSQGHARDTKVFLKDTLPTLLEVSGSDLSDPARVRTVIRAVEKSLLALHSHADEFAEAVLCEVATDAFGHTCSGVRDFQSIADKWRREIPPAARQHRYDSAADQLLQITGKQGDSIRQYLTVLPQNWGMAPYIAWTSGQRRKKYVATFKRSVQEIREFGESPVPILQRIHKQAFGSDIRDKEEFELSCKTWYDSLPRATYNKLENNGFGDPERFLREAINSVGPIEKRFLVRLPERLKLSGIWPTWHAVAQNVLCQDVAAAVNTLNTWQPALSLEELMTRLVDRIWNASFDSVDDFDDRWRTWYSNLPITTKQHDFSGFECELLAVLDKSIRVSDALCERLPKACGLPHLSDMQQASDGDVQVERLVKAHQSIEAWRRPLLEVFSSVHNCLGWSELHGALREESEFIIRLSEYVEQLPNARLCTKHFGNDVLIHRFFQLSGAGSRWREELKSLLSVMGLPDDPHRWTGTEDSHFTGSISRIVKEITDWRPPITSDIQGAYNYLVGMLTQLQEQFRISGAELNKLLYQVLNEKPQN